MNVPKPYQGKEKFIFISYSHRDTARVFPIIFKLMEKGYRVWYDQGIDPGTEWDENIATHIDSCGYFIAFMSQNYLGSSNCKDELNYARDLEKDRLIVYLEEVTLPAGMAMRVNRIQSVFKYTYPNEDSFYEKLFTTNNIDVCLGDDNEESDIRATDIPDTPKADPVYTPPVAPAPSVTAEIPTAEAPAAPTVKKKKKTVAIIAAIAVAVLFIIGVIVSQNPPQDTDTYDPDTDDYINTGVSGVTTFEMTDEDGMISSMTYYYEDDTVYTLVEDASIYMGEDTTEDDIDLLLEDLEYEFSAALELDCCEITYYYDEETYYFTLTFTSTGLDNVDNINALVNAGILETDINDELISFELSKEMLLDEGYTITYQENE